MFRSHIILLILGSLAGTASLQLSSPRAGVTDVGSERQLFLDRFWFDSEKNVALELHQPVPREVAIQCDTPWEQRVSYSSVIYEAGRYRMYYRVDHTDPATKRARSFTPCAESRDGIRWEKPKFGLFEFQGSTANNILPDPDTLWNASVIVDPTVKEGVEGHFKMISRHNKLSGFVSADGLRWRPVATNPLLTERPFNSHNTLIWDDEKRLYVIYMRGNDKSVPGSFEGGRRAIRRSESKDFLHWSPPTLVVMGDAGDPVDLHLYTSAAVKYYRAGGAFLMFPMVLYVNRSYPGALYPGLSDVQFTSSRDGIRWNRELRSPLLTPGPDKRNWVDRNPIMGQGIVPTGPDEISMYYSEFFRSPESRIRRCTLRTDGFVSVRGPYEGWGEFTTRPLRFAGRRLELNYSTSGGGGIQVELQDEAGSPFPGFALEDCPTIFGDRIEGDVIWKVGGDLSSLAGRPARLRVRLRDAHVYAFRFAP